LIIITVNVLFVNGRDFPVDKDTTIKKIHIEKTLIQKYKQNPDYDYKIEETKPNFIQRMIIWLQKAIYKVLYKILTWIFNGKKAHYIIVKIISVLPYISIAVFLYFLFRYLLGVDLLKLRRDKKYKSPKIYLNEEERIMHEENMDQLIEQALNKEDYRLAVRYYYLKLLKYLTDRNWIDWKPDKTNREYVKEITKKTYKEAFESLSEIYDYVWYGKYFPGAKDFEEIQNNYKRFLQDIEKDWK